ncbi:MAG: formylglycine-generating enzyme family protein [Alphaproteobacteria bacterium]
MGHLDTNETRLKNACRLLLDQKGLGGNVFGPEAPLDDIRRVCQALRDMPIAVTSRSVLAGHQKELLELRGRLPHITDTDDPGGKYCAILNLVVTELTGVLVAISDGDKTPPEEPADAPTPLPSTWGEQCAQVQRDIAALKEEITALPIEALPDPYRGKILRLLAKMEELLSTGATMAVVKDFVTRGLKENLDKLSTLFNHQDVQKAITSAICAAAAAHAANSPAVGAAVVAAGTAQVVGPRLWKMVRAVWTGCTGLLASVKAPLPERKEPKFTFDQEGTSNKPSPPPSGGRGLGEGGAEALDRVPPAPPPHPDPLPLEGEREKISESVQESEQKPAPPADPPPAPSPPGPITEPRTGIRLLPIPAGEFMMGAKGISNCELPIHRVRVPGFLLGETPVTNRQYGQFLSTTKREKPYRWGEDRFSDPEQPVVGVRWTDAVAFCAWLSEGSRFVFSLPSEAQWEYAARGTDGRDYPWGNAPPTPRHACYGLYWEKDKPARVGSFPAGRGPFGTLDQAGLVWELCADEWHDTYDGAPDDGTAWTSTGSAERGFRVLRGGAWGLSPGALRAAYRYWGVAVNRDDGIGFRVAATPASTAIDSSFSRAFSLWALPTSPLPPPFRGATVCTQVSRKPPANLSPPPRWGSKLKPSPSMGEGLGGGGSEARIDSYKFAQKMNSWAILMHLLAAPSPPPNPPPSRGRAFFAGN